MSHIRNLFRGHSEHAQPLPSTAVVVAPEEPLGRAAVVRPTFPIEQASISPPNRLVFHADPRSPAAERFRLLSMRLLEHQISRKLKKLLITSPLAHDGKSTVLLNLATALCERGKHSVLVIEADLHNPSLAAGLRLNSWAGVTDCLQDGSISPLSTIRLIEPLGWHFIPAGRPHHNATELLHALALARLIQKVSECFDWVLIDSPPVIPLTDAMAFQRHVDASLLVVRAGQTPREAIEQAVDILGAKTVAGIVLNGVERRNQPHYEYGYPGSRDD
jgi:polysaccharide biosynthesis transport protein